MQLLNIDSVEKLLTPESTDSYTLDMPASNFITNFRDVKPLVIDVDSKAVFAEQLMKKAHVRLKIVIDREGQFLGLLHSKDISEQKIMAKVAQGGDRDELRVSDFMIPRKSLQGLSLAGLEKYSIRKVINDLKDVTEQHILIFDAEVDAICGALSSSEIARKLSLSIDTSQGTSFKDIYDLTK